MTGEPRLRAAVTGLVGLAAVAEQELLAEPGLADPGVASPGLASPGLAGPGLIDPPPAASVGGARRWAAAPLVAHNTEFRRQQVQRLRAIRSGQVPPEFAEVDHTSVALYDELCGQPEDVVARDSWRVAGELAEEMRIVRLSDLTEPARNPWLRGRQLWLQVVVRGFWHPLGHLGDYYLSHGQPDRAVALAEHAMAAAHYLGAPAQARGMASYNLACAQAGAGLLDEAAAAVTEAVMLNPDVRANALRDADLRAVRDSGRLAGLMGA